MSGEQLAMATGTRLGLDDEVRKAIAAAVKGHIYWLVVIAVLMSVVSLFFYMNVVRKMFFQRHEDESRILFGPTLGLGIVISGAMVILICVLPSTFYEWAYQAARVFFPQI